MMEKTRAQLVITAIVLGNVGVAAADCSVPVINMGSFNFPVYCDSGGVRGVAYGTQGVSITAGLYGSGNSADSLGYTISGTPVGSCYAYDDNPVPGQDDTDSSGCANVTKQDLYLDT